MSSKKPYWISAGVIVSLVVFAALLGTSVQYIEYYEYALLRQKSTGKVGSTVYHSDRIFKGPDYEVVVYPSTSQFVKFDAVSALTQDNLVIEFRVTFQYFLRKEDVYLLYTTHKHDYADIIQKTALDSFKDTATRYTIREFLTKRPLIKEDLFISLREKLEGTCCLRKCASRLNGCRPSCMNVTTTTCTQGLFVELRYFQLGDINFHHSVKERMLAVLILTEDEERKQLEQQATLVRTETEAAVRYELNKVDEIKRKASSFSQLIRKSANADYLRTVETARGDGLQQLFGDLNFTSEDQKKSFDYLRTLQQSTHVHISVGYDQMMSGTWSKP